MDTLKAINGMLDGAFEVSEAVDTARAIDRLFAVDIYGGHRARLNELRDRIKFIFGDAQRFTRIVVCTDERHSTWELLHEMDSETMCGWLRAMLSDTDPIAVVCHLCGTPVFDSGFHPTSDWNLKDGWTIAEDGHCWIDEPMYDDEAGR